MQPGRGHNATEGLENTQVDTMSTQFGHTQGHMKREKKATQMTDIGTAKKSNPQSQSFLQNFPDGDLLR